MGKEIFQAFKKCFFSGKSITCRKKDVFCGSISSAL
jgi:hypothetical protein